MGYVAIVSEGGLFPSDLLDRIASGQAEGQRPEQFGLKGTRLTDEIQGAFSDARSFWDAFQRRIVHSRESSTTLTRKGWIEPLLERLGFDLVTQRTIQVGNDSYPIAYQVGEAEAAPPVHVVALDQPIGRRSNGSRRSPHALVQEYLNHSDALWGIVTNGERLRLLRNSARLARPTYVEFDLRAMVEGNLYSEFVLFYRLLHRTRFPRGAADAHECLLERYYQQGIDEGGRVREHLRDGVEAALRELGTGLLAQPDSAALREDLRSGDLREGDFYRELLRLVYRLLFLMVAEERRLIFPPAGHDQAVLDRQAVYLRYYSLTHLRDRCERYFADDRHSDLWQGLLQTFRLLQDESAALLGLSPLDGELFGPLACQHVQRANCENSSLLRAIYHLSTFTEGAVRRRVNYAALDVEELGSVYESLLDYRPHVDLRGPAGTPRFELVAGSERKRTGSYYTPPELVRELIDHALVPVMEERLAAAKTTEEKQRMLLDLHVCDPASGSGHFLLAAARRIARELARLRTGEEEPTPEAFRVAVRDVIRNCIYAVDKNPLAVDLCKVALWIEGHTAGLPLSFLDQHVKCGDSLVGVFDLEVLRQGIPDEAYTAVAGDDKKVATAYRKRNKEERGGQLPLGLAPPTQDTGQLARDFHTLAEMEERTPADVQAKQGLYESLRGLGTDWWERKVACDLWTYAFFAPLVLAKDGITDGVPTTGTVRDYLLHPHAASGQMVGRAVAESEERRFFHWRLEFPEVFASGGFDVVLGNPPFMGGLVISQALGDRYRKYLEGGFGRFRDRPDLSAAFLRRAFDGTRLGGSVGIVATNTIGQGDTRQAGLAPILEYGGIVVFVRRFIKWPGVANVEVNLRAVFRGLWSQPRVLDGMVVPFISSRLDSEPEAEAKRLFQNDDKAFQGFNLHGIGFVIGEDEATKLLTADPRNRDCVFPYLSGEDLNGRVDQSPSRWVIFFHDWSLVRAQEYPALLEIVEQRVRPERMLVKSKRPRERWWLFEHHAPGLRRATAGMNRVLVRSEVSEHHMLSFVPADIVFSHMLVVFSFDAYYHFALLQSNVHEAWVRRNASAMRTDIRYTPTDCFDNFPFPQEPAQEHQDQAAKIGEQYHEHRRQTMLARNLGLTKTYNLFHDPECQDADTVRLRRLHAEMDEAVLACYGWQDLDPNHDFYQNDRGQTRFTISPEVRREVLARLLDLNQRIAAEEEAKAIRPKRAVRQ